MFAERFKQSLDRRLPHFSTSVPYVVATILIMMVPLSVVLSQQETRIRSDAASSQFVTVTVEDEVTGEVIAGAFVSINDLDNCKTTQDGSCDLDIPSDAGPYSVYAIKEDYIPESQTFPELSNGIYITLKLTPDDTASSGPSQSSDESQNPNESSGPFQQNKRPNEQYDNSSDPNTGSPPDDSNDSGRYTQTPGPDDFGCLGGDCGTPNDCLTPAPGEEGSPDDTGAPSPTDGLYESIIERVQRQITETWNQVLSGLGGRNPNLKPPEFAN